MKKLQLLGLFLTLLVGCSTLFSCSSDEDFNMIERSDEDINSFEVLMKSQKNREEASLYGLGTVSFKSNQKVDFQIIDENTFTYDIAKNGNFDLLVKRENNFFVFYDSSTNEKLVKTQLIKDGNKGTLAFADNYINKSAKRGGWRACFEGNLDNISITLKHESNLNGIWSTVGFLSGVTVGCSF